MLKISNKQMIDSSDWDEFVCKTYNRPYCLQQQDGCYPNGTSIFMTCPIEEPYDYDDFEEGANNTLGNPMGVSFKSWLKAKTPEGKSDWVNNMFWERNLYPSLEMLVNDLHNKGLLAAGEYVIHITW